MSGNFLFGTMLPWASRPLLPGIVDVDVHITRGGHAVLAIASAVSLTILSSTVSAKWFQLFQPIGGVFANPL